MEKRAVKGHLIMKIPTDLTNFDVIQSIYGEIKDEIEKKGSMKLILDFSQVNAINSSAIGKLLYLNTRIVSNNGYLGFLHLQEQIQKLFKSLLIEKVFRIYASENEII